MRFGVSFETLIMKRYLLLFGLSLAFLTSYGDTIDFWHVYINDSVVVRYNAVSDDLTIHLKSTSIADDDEISIRHWDDTPCLECKQVLFVRDEKHRKLRITETDEFGGKMTFSLKDLLDFGRKNDSKRYDFYYWEIGSEGRLTPMTLVLQLTVD